MPARQVAAESAHPPRAGKAGGDVPGKVSIAGSGRKPLGSVSDPSRARDLSAELAREALTDPVSAMGKALSRANWMLRRQLRDAVLRSWASVSPAAAADWAMALPSNERLGADCAILAGAVAQPGRAVSLGERLVSADPQHASDLGAALIGALSDAGDYSAAVQFVTSSPQTPLQSEQINTTFQNWAQYQPEAALMAAGAISDPDLKAQALRGVSVGWANADPIGLAQYAASQPPGDLRAQELANALPQWANSDPAAALAWIDNQGPSADFDMGYEAISEMPDLVNLHPVEAMALAEKIADPQLRGNALRNLALKWGTTDAAAASSYVQSSPNFEPSEKTLLIGEIRGQL
ncbi:MAG TPA: hypothetical protein VGG34_11685 [Opitutaceae bacterium]